MSTVVILGAAGRIGDAAARAFAARGWTVRGVARNARVEQIAPDVVPIRADATDRAALVAACAGADVILNCLNPLYTEWEEKVMPMAENVIAASEAVGATHLLPGNVYNFGHEIGLGMADDAPQSPSTAKAAIRIAMEELFRRRAAETGVQTLVLRAGDFYGGVKPQGWLDTMILASLRKNVFRWPGPMDLPHAFAYLPDLGRAFVDIAEHRRELPVFDSFNFAGHTFTGAEMMALVETVTGRRLRRAGAPWALFRAAGIFVPLLKELAAMSYLWRLPHSLDGAKLERLTGGQAGTPKLDALRQAIRDLDLDDFARAA